MFSKLAWKNVRRSVKDYGVWFLTIAFVACLFYVLNALENQSLLRFLAQNPKVNVVEAIQRLIGILAVFVWAVLAFLILYASGFLIRRRKSTLDTSLLLGMERWLVARLLLERFEAMNELCEATILMVTHDAFTASYCHRILFLRDGAVFAQLERGDQNRRDFFRRIIGVVSELGGDQSEVL